MYYNITPETEKYFFFLLKTIMQCEDGDGDEAGIPEPVENGDEIRFLNPVRYG